jgi:hypothetical protein
MRVNGLPKRSKSAGRGTANALPHPLRIAARPLAHHQGCVEILYPEYLDD